MRPIDADAFKKYISERYFDTVGMFKTDEYRMLAKQITEGILSDIDEQPTIQPEKAQLFSEDTTSIQPVANDTNVGDKISRQQAIELIKNYCENGCDIAEDNWCPSCQREQFMKLLKALPTVPPEPQWIPVERELPEDYTDVLVWFEYFRYGDYNRMCATHGIGNYSKKYNSWTINHETGWKDLHVFAWMPLPEAYKPNK